VAPTNVVGVASAVLGTVLTAGAAVYLRKLVKTESATVSLFYNAIGICIACAAAVPWLSWIRIAPNACIDVIVLGAASGTAQLLNTWAY
jgi:drug/metabolite transporter (DMT)-like permease